MALFMLMPDRGIGFITSKSALIVERVRLDAKYHIQPIHYQVCVFRPDGSTVATTFCGAMSLRRIQKVLRAMGA